MKVKCWKCHGRGWLFDHEDGIFTFGIGYLVQALAGKHTCNIDGEYVNSRCPICEGRGYQETGYTKKNMLNNGGPVQIFAKEED